MVSIVLSPPPLSSFSVRNQANSFSKWGILHSEARQWVPFTGHSVSSNRDHGACQQSACETGTVQYLKANQGTDTCRRGGPALWVGSLRARDFSGSLEGQLQAGLRLAGVPLPTRLQSSVSSSLTPVREAKGTSWESSSWWSNFSGLQFQA